jgi:hypothetical protein
MKLKARAPRNVGKAAFLIFPFTHTLMHAARAFVRPHTHIHAHFPFGFFCFFSLGKQRKERQSTTTPRDHLNGIEESQNVQSEKLRGSTETTTQTHLNRIKKIPSTLAEGTFLTINQPETT